MLVFIMVSGSIVTTMSINLFLVIITYFKFLRDNKLLYYFYYLLNYFLIFLVIQIKKIFNIMN